MLCHVSIFIPDNLLQKKRQYRGPFYICVCAQTSLGLVEVFAAIVLFELLVGCVKMEGGLINGPDDEKLFLGG